MSSESGKHVVVVGAGVIGLSVAYYCARAGHRVTVVERQAARRGGCSYGNAGMIVPSHFIPLAAPGMVAMGLKWMLDPESPFYIKPRISWELLSWGVRFWRASTPERVAQAAPLLRDLNLFSRTCFTELADAGLEFGLEKRGLLMLCKTGHALEEEAQGAARARSLGIPAEVLDSAATARQDPAVRMDVAGSVYYPMDCHLSPERYIDALERSLEKMGADLRWEVDVTDVRTDGRRIVALETNQGEIAGDEFVFCGGAWSSELGRQISVSLPMQAGKGYSLTLKQPPKQPALCSILTEARVAVTPMGSSLRVGGTMEIAGINDRINPKRVRGIVRVMPKYFPEFSEDNFEGIQPWFGLRPCSPDGLPYLGRTDAWQNVVIAAGHAMMGLSLAPGTGRLAAELVSGQETSVPLGLLSPDRYNL